MKKIQDTRNILHRTMMPQYPSKKVPWDLTQFSQSLSAAMSCFPESHQQSEISSLSKVILVLGKARSHRAPNLGCTGSESPGWFDVSLKNSAWDVIHEWVHCCDEVANHQLPIAVAFWIIWIFSTEVCLSLMQNLMHIHCSTCSVILNAMATQHTCSLNGVYRPHWLVQWSRHCSHMHIPLNPPWLPGYISFVQTVLVILTMVGLFPDRPSTSSITEMFLLKTIFSSLARQYIEPSLMKKTSHALPVLSNFHYLSYFIW